MSKQIQKLNLTHEKFLNCVCDVLELQCPEFNDLSDEQHQALLDCFKAMLKGDSKKSKTTKEKSDMSDTIKKPGNVWISWLKLNRDALKTENGGEDGLAAILKERYTAFKRTPAYGDLQNECAEKMREYKEKSDVDSDDEKPKKKTKAKAKKVEKSPEEKKPLNVYMAFLREHLDEIKANLDGKSFNEAKKEAYAAFQKTPAFKTLEAKCKNELKVWNETVPKKAKVVADSESDDEVVEKKKPVKKSKKVVVESVSSDEVPVVEKPKSKTDKSKTDKSKDDKSKDDKSKKAVESDSDEVVEKPKEKSKKVKKAVEDEAPVVEKQKKNKVKKDDDETKKKASVDALKKAKKQERVESDDDDEAPDGIEKPIQEVDQEDDDDFAP